MKRNLCLSALLCLGVLLFANSAGFAFNGIVIEPYSFVQAEGPWPDSIAIPIVFEVDSTLGGYALGFALTGPGAEYFRITSIVHDGPCEPNFNTLIVLDTLNGTYGLVGWITFSPGFYCVAPHELFATFYLQVDPDAPAGTFASLDSTFIPPAGDFNMTPPSGIGFIPDFDNGSAEGKPNIALGDTTGVEIVLAAEGVTIDGDTILVGKGQSGSTALGFTTNIRMGYAQELNATINAYYTQGNLHGRSILSGEPDNSTFDAEVGLFVFTPDQTQENTTFDVVFSATDENGRSGQMTLSIFVDVVEGVMDLESPTLPTEYSLAQNYPNPFNPTTTIDFSVPKPGDVRLEIFNILGQSIRVLVDEYLTAGEKRVQWDGQDESGRSASSGIYLYRLTADEFGQTKKMMLLK